MSEVSDLVLDSRLDTRFHEKYVYHVYHESDAAKGQRTIQRREFWQRQRHLGSGGFGSVWLELCVKGQQEGSMRAVKEIQRPQNQFECNRELEAISKFSHARYARCFAKSFGWYEQGRTFYLAMEYFPLGDLQSYLIDKHDPLPEPEAQQITFQILEGLKFMHDNGFAHRDIKPANLLVQSRPPQDWWIKISDFGISKRFRDSQGISTTIKGTLAFMAPELHGIHPPGGKQPIIPNATDLWALGEIAHQLLTKLPVFDNVGALYQFVLGIEAFPKDKLRQHTVSEDAISLIQLAMSPLPTSRLTADQALRHPWVELLRPAASPDLPDLDLPETSDMLADLDLDEPSARWTTLGSTVHSTAALDHTNQPLDTGSGRSGQSHIKSSHSPWGNPQPEPNTLEDKTISASSSGSPITQKKARTASASVKHPIDKPRILRDNQERELTEGNWHIANDCNVAVFGSREGEVSLEVLVDNVEAHESFKTPRRITSINVGEYPGLIACGHQNGEVSIWDMNGVMKERLRNTFNPNPEPITGIGFALSGKRALIFTKKFPPVIWDYRSGRCRELLTDIEQARANQFVGRKVPPDTNDRALDQFTISPDGKLLAIKVISSYTEERTMVTVVDIDSRRQLANGPFAPDSWTTELAFSRDGKILAYTTLRSIVVWEHTSKRVIGKFDKSYDHYRDFTFSQDGKMLAAIRRQAIHFWTIEDGIEMIHILELHQFWRVGNIVFTPDDTLIGVGVKGRSKKTLTCAIYEFPTPQ